MSESEAPGSDARARVRARIDAVWRIESARLIAGLARMVHDVGLAEELAQDALVAVLEQWPESGVPDNPGAWLMTTGKRRAIDRFRRDERFAAKLGELGRDLEQEPGEPDDTLDAHFGDDLLGLVFTACHPVLAPQARVALVLRMLGGLSTKEIARAYLVSESTMAQRIVRAKRTLTKERVRFTVPGQEQLHDRLDSVLEVVYLIFNEGYSATAGDDWMRPALCEEAQRLGRMLATLLPGEPEVHGLIALLELQGSRTAARLGPRGEPVLLLDQDRGRWDRLLIGRGLEALGHAVELAAEPGPYTLQAAIAACHARAVTAEETDWARIAALYEQLARRTGSPVVELNRAVALGMAYGPEAGLGLVDELRSDPALRDYYLLASVRGDLLAKLGRAAEARAEFARAAELTGNAAERAVMRERAESTV